MSTIPTNTPQSRNFVRPSLPKLPDGQTSMITSAPIPTPSFPDPLNMSFSIFARTRILAPASLVTASLLNNQQWGVWNSFIPRCDVVSPLNETLEPGFFASSLMELLAGNIQVALPPDRKLLNVGDRMTFHVNMAGKPLSEMSEGKIGRLMKSTNVVRHVERIVSQREDGRRGFRIVWTSTTTMGGLLRAERVQEIIEMPPIQGMKDGCCEYVTWETFGGLGASVVRWTSGSNLVKRFADWERDLKARGEYLWRQKRADENAKRSDEDEGVGLVTKDKHGNWALVNKDGS